MARQAMQDVSAAAFRWEPVPDGVAPDDPRRRRRVRALVVACVVGALAIIATAIVATAVLVHEAHKRDDRAHCFMVSTEPGLSCRD